MNWDLISLSQYYEILDIQSDTLSDYNIQLIGIIEDLDITSDEFLDLELDEIYDKIEQYKFIRQPIIPKPFVEVNEYKLLPLNQLELGAYIDLELQLQKEQYKSMDYLCAVVLRKDNEEYDYDINKRRQEFLELSVNKTYYIFNEVLKFKQLISDSYPIIFKDNEDLDDNIETDNLTEAEIHQIKKEIQADKDDSNFSWQYLLLELSNDDITKIPQILKLNVLFVFNMLVAKRRLQKKHNQ